MFAQAHLLTNEFGVRPDTLGVAACHPVVFGEYGDEFEHLTRVGLFVGEDFAALLDLCKTTLYRTRRAGLKGYRKA